MFCVGWVAMPWLSRPFFGIDARHFGCTELFYGSMDCFAAAFLKGVVQCSGIRTKSSVTTACLSGRSFDSLKHDLRILFSFDIEIAVINNAATLNDGCWT